MHAVLAHEAVLELARLAEQVDKPSRLSTSSGGSAVIVTSIHRFQDFREVPVTCSRLNSMTSAPQLMRSICRRPTGGTDQWRPDHRRPWVRCAMTAYAGSMAVVCVR